MRVLITGSSGMVGKNILEHPEISSYEILKPTSSELNLLGYSEVKDYLEKYKPDLIIHAAGRVGGIQANIKEPVSFLLDNLDMGRNVVGAAREVGIKKLINLGSSCMYPKDATNPLKEEYILQGMLEPTNEGYALAKITTARLCEYISKEDSNFQYKTLVPCNLYGRWDKFDPHHSHMIPAVIRKIHDAKFNGESEVEIWGDGTARREFMYAGDLADCIIKTINSFETLPSMLNVGLGYDFTINEYYKTIAEIVGYKGNFVHDLTKPVGMKQKVEDVSKLKDWGWSAKVDLKEGIANTYKFYLGLGEN
jgi:GDP-L-fucose synthase